MADGRSELDPPSGPLGDLVRALTALHRRAGQPSRRKISYDIRQRDDLRDTVSHETVSAMLRGESRPKWVKYESVVRYLAEFAVYQPNEEIPDTDAVVARFHALWSACVDDQPAGSEPVTEPAPPPRETAPLRSPAAHRPVTARVAGKVGGDPPPRNERFVGREHQIRAIHEVLRTTAPILTLTGIGGVGKTQLAAEYLYRFRDDYDVIWWVPAEHAAPMRASLAALGAWLDIPRSGDLQPPPVQVLEELGRRRLHWLLVFDNARSPRDLPVVRAWGAGKILLTSRDPDWSEHGPTLEVGVFERAESVELLRLRAANIAARDADTVAEKVGDLPLAVDQIANWHVATGTSVASFLARLDQQAKEIKELLSDSKVVTASYPSTLAGVLTVGLGQLATTAPVATQLLELFAWLGAEPLSLALLRRGRRGDVSSPLKEALNETRVLKAAVRELRRRGLMTVLDEEAERVQVHRLHQSVLRDWLEPDQLARGRNNVRTILAAANPGEPDDPRFWTQYEEVGPHIHQADFAAATDFEVRRVVLDQARYGHYDESNALTSQLVAAGIGSGHDSGGPGSSPRRLWTTSRNDRSSAGTTSCTPCSPRCSRSTCE